MVLKIENLLTLLVFLCLLGIPSKLSAQTHIDYSTYIGNQGDNWAYDLQVKGGVSHVVGATVSSNFPITNGSSFSGGSGNNFGDGYYMQLDATTDTLLFATYIGGSGDDLIRKVQVVGNVTHLVGYTSSSDFPVTNGSTHSGGLDIFYMQLDATTGSTIFSTYVGGSGNDEVSDIEVIGNTIHITGNTRSTDFPVTDTSTYKGIIDVYYMQLNTTNGSITLATYIGGNNEEYISALQIAGGEVHLTGTTVSQNFPVTNGSSLNGVSIFYMKLSPLDGTILFSTILGGSKSDHAFIMQVVGNVVHLAGGTSSPDFPVTNGSTIKNTTFLTSYYLQLDATTGGIIFSTYIGGSAHDIIKGIKVTGDRVHLSGFTESLDFPVTNESSRQSSLMWGSTGSLFYMLLDVSSGNILFSSHIGEIHCWYNFETGGIDVIGNFVYLIGHTTAPDYPVTNGSWVITGNQLSEKIVYTKLKLCTSNYEVPLDTLFPSRQIVCRDGFAKQIIGSSIFLPSDSMPSLYRYGALKKQARQEAKYQWQQSTSATGPWINITGAIQKDYSPHAGSSNMYYRRLALNNKTYCNDTLSISSIDTVEINSFLAPVVDAGGIFNTCPSNSVTIGGTPSATGGAPPYTYKWLAGGDTASISTNDQLIVNPESSTVYTLRVTDANFCDQVDQAIVNVHTAIAGPNISACAGDSAQIQSKAIAGLPGTTYTWSPSTGLNCTSCIQPKTLISVPTTYTLSMTINTSGGGTCTTNDSMVVSPISAPATPNFAGPDRVICFGSSAELGTPKDVVETDFKSVSQTSINVHNGTVNNLTDNNFTSGARTLGNQTIPFLSILQSSYANTGTVANLTDGIVNVLAARTNSGNDEFIVVDLGTIEDISGVQLSTTSAAELNSCQVQISIDGVNWDFVTTLSSLTNNTALATRLFPSLYRAKYIRFFRSGVGRINISELRVLKPSVITIDLANVLKNISRVELAAITAANLNGATLQTSTDGIVWINAISNITGVTNSGLTTFNFSARSVRYLRFFKAWAVLDLSEFRIWQEFGYTWAPGSYLSTNSQSQTTYNPGTLNFPPVPDSAIYYLTAERQGCVFTDQVVVSVITAITGIDGCGPRVVGESKTDVPTLDETFSWTKISGGGSFLGPTNTPTTTVSASPPGSPTIYQLTTTYRGVSCYDQVLVPDCGCNVYVYPIAAFDCPHIAHGPVTIVATPVPGDTTDYTYSWSPQAGLDAYDTRTVRLTDSVARLYTITITSILDSSFTCFNSIYVNQPYMQIPAFTALDTTLCLGNAIAIGQPPVAGYSYDWKPSIDLNDKTSSNPLTTTSISRKYSVTVTDDLTRCFTVDTADILVNNISANAGSDWIICSSDVVTLGGETPKPDHLYAWAPQGNWQNGTDSTFAQPQPFVAINTTFTLIATDTVSGCITTDTVDVIINDTPTIPDAPDVVICFGQSDTIGSPALPGVDYFWTPSTGLSCTNCAQPIASPTSTTTYTVTATFQGSCLFYPTDDVTVTVSNPSFSMTDITYCPSGGPVFLGSAAPTGMSTYNWTPASQVSNSIVQNTFTTSPPPNSRTTYTLTVTDVNGCVSSASLDIIPENAPPEAGDNRALCLGQSTVLGSGGNPTGVNISYSWSPATNLSDPNSPSPVFTPTSTGVFTYTLYKTDANTFCTSMSEVVVTVSDLQLPPLTNAIICQGASVQIGTVPSIGIEYFWTPGLTLSDSTLSNPIATPLTSTIYELTAVGANGCTDHTSVTVTVSSSPAPIVNIPDIEHCLGVLFDTLRPTVTPPANYNYLWTPNNGLLSSPTVPNPRVETGSIGTSVYTLTVTNASNGCSTSGTVSVTIKSTPIPTVKILTDNSICQGENTILTVSGNATSYNWDNGLGTGDNHSVSPTNTTTYAVTGIDTNGCTNTDSVTITVHSLPVITARDTSSCKDTSITLLADTPGAIGYVWTVIDPDGQINSGENTPTPNVSTSNIGATTDQQVRFQVEATDSNGCTNIHVVTVTFVAICDSIEITIPDYSICEGECVDVLAQVAHGTPPFYFTWDSEITSDTTAGHHNICPTATKTYSIRVQDVNGRYRDTTFTITVNPLPIVIAQDDTVICLGGTVPIMASGALTYSWDNSLGTGASHTVSPTTTTTYTVVGTDTNGCVNTDDVTVTVNPLPIVSAGNDTNLCLGASTILTATGANTYSWDNGLGTGASHTVSPTTTTTYTVVGTDANGCVNTDSVTVGINSGLNANFTATPLLGTPPLNIVFTNNSTGTTFYWDFGNGKKDTTTTPNGTTATDYLTTGTYTVMLIAELNGCRDTMLITINVFSNSLLIIPNIFTPNGDGINDRFKVRHEGIKTLSIQIYNRWGTLLTEITHVDGFWDGGDHPAGTYYFILKAVGFDEKKYEESGHFMLAR